MCVKDNDIVQILEMSSSSQTPPWCIYVTFEGTNLQKLKVPVNQSDSCRHLLIKVGFRTSVVTVFSLTELLSCQAKERARQLGARQDNPTELPDLQAVEAADSLIELSGATLFDGDRVKEVVNHQ